MEKNNLKQSNYVIGLDLGINNVGWSIVDLDNHEIEKCGVRLYKPSEDAKERRGARSVRRRLKRQKNRVNDTLNLFHKIGFEEKPTIDSKLIEKRILGLKEKITKQDIVNITKYHLTHRGYIPFDDEEINFVELNGKYPCEYYYELLKTNKKMRAQDKTIKTEEIKRELNDMLEKQTMYYSELKEIKNEIIKIFSRKREFWEGPGSLKSTTPFGRFKNKDDIEKYKEMKNENPAYEKYLFEELIGKCNVLYLDEKCAPIADINAQKFNLINDFINLTFNDISETSSSESFVEVKNGYKLNEKGINLIIDYCRKCQTSLKLDNMFKELFNLSVENASGYRVNKKEEIEMSTLDAYRNIIRIIKKEISYIPKWIEDEELYNKLIYYINVVPGNKVLIEMLQNDKEFKNIVNESENEIIEKIYKIIKTKYSGYHKLSQKALLQANIDMLAHNQNYQQIRKKLKYDKKYKDSCIKEYENSSKIKLLTKYVENIIASPQVKKTLRQSIRIINAIIEEKNAYPYCIAIESAKEMNGKERVKEIKKEQKIREDLRKRAVKIIESYGKIPNEALILKVMLYSEINGYCPYCNKRQINIEDVLNNRIEVEHILPISKSGDNSYNNKTIACSECNSKANNGKGDKTPYEWKKYSDYQDFKERIQNNNNFSDEKKANFLFEKDLDKYSIRFINRNLRDTAYATKELVNQIKILNYYLDSINKTPIKTLSTPGQITHNIRDKYTLKKDRDDGKYHHAVDACIVAAIADTSIGQIIINSQNNEKYWIIDKTYKVDKEKANKLSKYLTNVSIDNYYSSIYEINDDSKIYISSQVIETPQGGLSNANINKYIKIDNSLKIVSQIENIYEEDTKKLEPFFDEKSNKYQLMIKDNNPKLYRHLKQIYDIYKDKPGNPFKNYCFDKNTNDNFSDIKDFNPNKHGIKASENPKSPVVKKLRYYMNTTAPYLLEKTDIHKKENTMIGLDSLKQYCTEIYYDKTNNKFAFLPIYSISVNLKTKEINRNDKYYKMLKEQFLGNNEVVLITPIFNGNYLKFNKKNGQQLDGIYQYFHKTLNKLLFKNDNAFTTGDSSFALYDVDVLGNKKERLTYTIK